MLTKFYFYITDSVSQEFYELNLYHSNISPKLNDSKSIEMAQSEIVTL